MPKTRAGFVPGKIDKIAPERKDNFIMFTSKMDKDLKSEAQIYCIRNGIDLMDLIDFSVSAQIGYVPNKTSK